MRDAVTMLLAGIALYAGAGLLVAVWLLARGLGRVDAGARAAPLAFRAIITPGLIGLWPVMLRRARRAKRALPPPVTRDMRPHRRAHLLIWLVLTPVLIGGVLMLAFNRPPAPKAAP